MKYFCGGQNLSHLSLMTKVDLQRSLAEPLLAETEIRDFANDTTKENDEEHSSSLLLSKNDIRFCPTCSATVDVLA